MKRTRYGELLIAAALLFAPAVNGGVLEQRFADPREEAKPWGYWFWMNGNVTKEGITVDLEAMDHVGMGGALMMNVGLRTLPGPYDFNTMEWHDLYCHAAKECVRLGMKLTVHPPDGWATSGGQWIAPAQSMKLLVWNAMEVNGRAREPIRLEQSFTRERFYEDISVVAIPLPEDERPVKAGATVIGPKPLRTPGLEDWQRKPALLDEMAKQPELKL